MRDMISNLQTTDLSTDTLAGVTPNASTWLDTLGFSGAAIELMTGAVTDAGTAAGFTATLQHSDTTEAADAVTVPTAETTNAVNSLTVTDAIVRTVGRMGKPHTAPTTYVGTSVAAT